MSDTIDVTFYAQVQPTGFIGGRVRDARVARINQSRPTTPLGGIVLVKLTLRMPRAAFDPLSPATVVELPVASTEPVTVAVEQP